MPRLVCSSCRTGENALSQLIDSIPGHVFTTRANGELEWVNGTILAYFGRTLEDLRAWQMTESVHPDDRGNTIARWQQGVASGQPYEFEHRLRRHDGVYRWFHFRAAPLRDEHDRLFRWYGLVTDIDDLKRAQEGLRKIQDQLCKASQLATISELAASIAHEVNQPLAAVVANGHACHRWLSASPSNIERALLSVERVIGAGNSAAQIICRIRSLFRHAAPAKESLNLNEVIEDVCRLIADDVRLKGISLRLELQPDLPLAAADRVQMQQVIANLARNSIDAMEKTQGRPRELSIASVACCGEITIRVSDAGIGLSDVDAVFQPFYTTKPSGMGMGLAICKSILEAHGGRLWATQNALHGATFTFALCIADANHCGSINRSRPS